MWKYAIQDDRIRAKFLTKVIKKCTRQNVNQQFPIQEHEYLKFDVVSQCDIQSCEKVTGVDIQLKNPCQSFAVCT